MKRSFKPYQNEHNSVKDTGERSKKPRDIDLKISMKILFHCSPTFAFIYTSFTFEYPAEVSAEERGLSLFWSNYSKKFQLPTTSFVFLRLSGELEKNASKDRFRVNSMYCKIQKNKEKCTHLLQGLLFVAVQHVVKYINKDQFIIFHQSVTL